MPPRKSKTKSKSKPKRSSLDPGANGVDDFLPDSFLDDIDNAEGRWDRIVNILCDAFDIPNLTKRSGLKKVHSNFDRIYQRLDQEYKRHANNYWIQGGIVGIYAKMCVDSILRTRLFDKGVLSQLIPLLGIPGCVHLALQSLSTMTHHGGMHIRIEIAKYSPVLVKVMQQYPDDRKTCELAIATMAHSLSAAVCEKEPPDPKFLKALDIPTLIKVITGDTLRRPWTTRYLLSHAVELLACLTLHCTKACNANPTLLHFLAAGLRSKDLAFRMTALGGLIRLTGMEAQEDQRQLDPNKIIAAAQKFPPHLTDVIMDYGMMRCDSVLTLRSTAGNTKAFMRCLQDKDLFALGMTLSELILKNEFSVANGAFQSDNPRTGARENMGGDITGLPFTWWIDALPHCAKAMRAKGKVDEADIVELKYFIMKSRIAQAISRAKECIARSPDVAYYFYVVTLSGDGTEGLRAAKKGMKCSKTSPFVRFGMMHRAVEHAANMGLEILQSAHQGGPKWDEGIAFINSAVEDAKTYITEAPPDARHMKNVLYWYICLTIALKGPEMSLQLYELQSAFDKLTTADEFSVLFGITPPNTQMRLAQQAVVKYYFPGTQEWGSIVERFDVLAAAKVEPILPDKAENDLAAWLDEMHVDDGQDELAEPDDCNRSRTAGPDRVSLYRCSYCGNPSSVLRKCSGCGKTRYCDSSCQKSHWSAHKKACKTVPAPR
ncbi:hypothetical protein PLICRDRAFT_38074 [Plicaturopsis crispa FD-325 SS-3]|nr:hypothetical protein PLICRDRAFT_38074 [Plicaturopsis crispa FD-325 SS-3]